MAKALVVFASRTNQTRRIAELIDEGMRFENVDVTLVNANEVEKKGINLDDFDAFVLGSATYHGEIAPGDENFPLYVRKSKRGRQGGRSFRSFWVEWRSSRANF